MPTTSGERVLSDLRHLRTLGAYKTGVHRPSLSDEHMQSLRWLEGELKAIGHEAMIDGIGNVIGISPAKGRKLLGGSHLESQNHAGWLDGPLGVVYALEAARVVKDDPAMAGCAVDVAAWFDEEGHFGHFFGSRSAIGKLSEAEIDAAVDRTRGTTLRDALKATGLAGRARIEIDKSRYVGYLEAHIEQGDWLEASKLRIAAVTSIVGIRQFKVVFEGVQNHAGTTRMAIRRDAGLDCARLCVAIAEEMPKAAGERSVWTTGRITLDPGAPSIIPGRAEMLFQMRDDNPATLDRMQAMLTTLVEAANRRGPCKASLEVLRSAPPPAVMAPAFVEAVATAAEARQSGCSTRMPSGAGHDAQVMSQVMPSGMLFVPSIGGISHHWTENTSDEDIAFGAEVYVDAVKRLLKG
ncbi:MAG: Zn-dependent hydrolase [Proteobacteria bacterium]|nr:Zn-dependent hydrolase [Pseudomonadota bacterium]